MRLCRSITEHRAAIDARYAEWSAQGYRVLGVAVRDVPRQAAYTVDSDECDMIFAGFLLFFDPPKPDARETLAALAQLGVQVKIITGDNRLVARHVAETVGLAGRQHPARQRNGGPAATRRSGTSPSAPRSLPRWTRTRKSASSWRCGRWAMWSAIWATASTTRPRCTPRTSASRWTRRWMWPRKPPTLCCCEHDLGVLRAGIEEGRRTFANTLKYIFTTTSANFGNMFSMAGASLFLPFLPLLAKQILLNNFLSDFPAMGIAGDNVDEEMVAQPHRWDIRFIRDFMIIFGLVSSVFDYATFGLLLLVVHATEQQFQTGWFVESLLTELVIALVVRTRRPFFRSRPGTLLWTSTLAVSLVTLAVPYLPFGEFLGFTPLPAWVMAVLVALTGLYVVAAEMAKKFFYARVAL